MRAQRNALVKESVTLYNTINPPEPAKRTFVNSFGEATDSYVTSSSYERAMRRNEREIQSRMKGFK